MTNPNSPELLSTHQYINESVNQFGTLTQHDVFHRFTTMVLDATAAVPQPHVLDARLTVPVAENPETGELRPDGLRTLQLELRSDFVPKRTGHTPGTKSVSAGGNTNVEQRVFAEATFRFNTKRIDGVYGEAWADGQSLGISRAAARDGSSQNFLLSRLAELGGFRSLGVARAAEFVTGVSLDTAGSSERTRVQVELGRIAREISQGTGKEVPLSLRRVPFVEAKSKQQLSAHEHDATIGWTTTTIDSHNFQANRRTIANWYMTQYNGFMPADRNHHLGLYSVYLRGGVPDGRSFGIDAHQRILHLDSNTDEERWAATYAEARDIASPFINAVASLRRYHTAVHRYMDAA